MTDLLLATRLSALAQRVLVVGFARTGQAVASLLVDGGVEVCAYDDAPADLAQGRAAALGVPLIVDADALAAAAAAADVIVVSPGVSPQHALFSLADHERIISEIELAFLVSDVPLVAITGTNGKTTVTGLVASMLEASGLRVKALGNIGVPLIEVARAPELDVVVAEVSSFQLELTRRFAPQVGTWLNLAEDHLDWHPSLAAYAAAKAKIWAAQGPDDVAVYNADDELVAQAVVAARATPVSFGAKEADFCLRDGCLVGPEGVVIELSELPRQLPHDALNALAAIASATSAGASYEGCAAALAHWQIPAHRVELVGELDGVSYYDDSKATTPSAVIAALQGFASAVLIAGGRNKGLDISAIRRYVDGDHERRLRAVVAIGEAAPEVVAAFAPDYRVERVTSMTDAVATAALLAEPGDAVLLSPGCASFDWYSSYEERGEDFKRAVRDRSRR